MRMFDSLSRRSRVLGTTLKLFGRSRSVAAFSKLALGKKLAEERATVGDLLHFSGTLGNR